MAIIFAEAFNTYDEVEGLGNSLEKVGYRLSGDAHQYVVFGTVGGRRTVSGYRGPTDPRFRAIKQVPFTADFTVGAAFLYEGNFANLYDTFHYPLLGATDGADVFSHGAGVCYDRNTQRFKLYIAGLGYLEVPAITPTADTWYYFELEFVGGDVNLYVDDVLMLTATQSTANLTHIRVGCYTNGSVDGTAVHLTDLYASNSLAPNAGRLGPVKIVPLIPTSDGTEVTGFAATPSGTIYETVDDHAGNSGTDADSSFSSGIALNSGFSVGCTAETAFTGDALAYFVQGVAKSASVTGLNMEYVITDGANEVATGSHIVTVPDYTSHSSQYLTALPGGVALNQLNFEAMEFGVRLRTP